DHDKIGKACVFVDELDVVPGLAAVGGFVDSTFLIRSEQVSEHRHVNYVRILRIDDDAGDRLRILEAHLREGLAAIGRFIDAVAEARTLAVIGLAGPYPNDVGIRRRNGDVPNRSSRIGVENRRESRAVIDGFPDSAGRKAHVVSIWVALYGGD